NLMKGLKLESRWAPMPLEEILPDAAHREVVRRLLDGFGEATLAYPDTFLDMARALRALAKPGGLLLVNDYGSCEAADLEGLYEPVMSHFGNTLSHEMNFAIFDAFAAVHGLAATRTHAPLRIVHTAALLYAPGTPDAFAREFERSEIVSDEGDD